MVANVCHTASRRRWEKKISRVLWALMRLFHLLQFWNVFVMVSGWLLCSLFVRRAYVLGCAFLHNCTSLPAVVQRVLLKFTRVSV